MTFRPILYNNVGRKTPLSIAQNASFVHNKS